VQRVERRSFLFDRKYTEDTVLNAIFAMVFAKSERTLFSKQKKKNEFGIVIGCHPNGLGHS